jgi:hypothetical protein
LLLLSTQIFLYHDFIFTFVICYNHIKSHAWRFNSLEKSWIYFFLFFLPTGRNCSHLSCIHLPMILLVIALPLDV